MRRQNPVSHPHKTRYVLVGIGLTALFALSLPAISSDEGTTAGPSAKHAKANYELASQWTASKVGKLVFDTSVTPHWLETGDRFWYSFEDTRGRKFWLVDPVKKTRSYVFDPVKLATQLTLATGLPYDSPHLPINTIRYVKNDASIEFEISVPREAVIPGEKPPASTNTTVTTTNNNGGNDEEEEELDDQAQQQVGGRGGRGGPAPGQKLLTFEYELATAKLTLLAERPARKPAWASMSPDGKWVVFSRDHNLFMMDDANYAKALKNANDTSIVEIQLTKDGVEDFSYGGRGMGAGQDQQQQQDQQQNDNTTGAEQNTRTRGPANVSWSRDSKKFALVRRDSLKVEKLWVINSLANPRPTLETYRYAMPGDVNIPQSQLEIFDVATQERKIFKAEAFKDQTLSVEVERPNAHQREAHEKTEAVWAGPGSDKLYFTRTSRDLHRVDVCTMDTTTGEVKPLIQERMNVYIETKPLRVINDGAEMIWWSERDGWGHYYLYDSNGTIKNQVTKGEFVDEDIAYVDEKARQMYLSASGREDGENPYYTHFYRAGLDGNGMKLLDPGDASHSVQAAGPPGGGGGAGQGGGPAWAMSEDGKYFVDNSSRVNSAPEAVLYDNQGASVMPLEKVDLKPLTDVGFKFPEPFKVKADDGITDLYGVMYKPFDFDANHKYPLIEYVYPGPQTESVTQTFSPRSANMMLANLGFIVIEVGNRGGNPHRSKWYHTFGYGNLRDYGLADKKRAAEELAEKYSFIDIDRVGITGHSGGGFMSTAAMLIYPDFFKVAVSESGNHENNIYNNTWSEKHHGLKEVTDKDGKVTFEYSIDKNSEIAKNLKGHLLLSTGDIDNNVHPGNTIRLADALIKAHKRFDLVVLPGQRHAYGNYAEYFAWVRADYFCKYLLGDFDQSVDMWELNRETPAADKTPRQVTTQTTGQGQQQQQQNGRGGRGGRGNGGGGQ